MSGSRSMGVGNMSRQRRTNTSCRAIALSRDRRSHPACLDSDFRWPQRLDVLQRYIGLNTSAVVSSSLQTSAEPTTSGATHKLMTQVPKETLTALHIDGCHGDARAGAVRAVHAAAVSTTGEAWRGTPERRQRHKRKQHVARLGANPRRGQHADSCCGWKGDTVHACIPVPKRLAAMDCEVILAVMSPRLFPPRSEKLSCVKCTALMGAGRACYSSGRAWPSWPSWRYTCQCWTVMPAAETGAAPAALQSAPASRSLASIGTARLEERAGLQRDRGDQFMPLRIVVEPRAKHGRVHQTAQLRCA